MISFTFQSWKTRSEMAKPLFHETTLLLNYTWPKPIFILHPTNNSFMLSGTSGERFQCAQVDRYCLVNVDCLHEIFCNFIAQLFEHFSDQKESEVSRFIFLIILMYLHPNQEDHPPPPKKMFRTLIHLIYSIFIYLSCSFSCSCGNCSWITLTCFMCVLLCLCLIIS